MSVPFALRVPLLTNDPTDPKSKLATETPVVDDGLVARFRKRLFEPRVRPAGAQPSPQAPQLPKREINFRASLAEFLLINRLRARRKAAPSADVLAHGERIVFITCKNWFGTTDSPPPDHRTRL